MATPKPRQVSDAVVRPDLLRATLVELLGVEVAEAAIFNALRRADCRLLPSDAAGFVMFVLGPLDISVERLVGRRKADALLDALDPALENARVDVDARRHTSDVVPASVPPDPPLHDSGVHRIVKPSEPFGEPVLETAKTALVVNPDPTERHALSRFLRDRGMRVVTSPDGHMALALCVRYSPDVVIVKLVMPGVSGRRLCNSIGLALSDASPPVILLVPKPIDLPPGAVAALTEPVDHERLYECMEQTLEL